MSSVFLGLAGVSYWLARRVMTRVALSITRTPGVDEGEDVITVRHMTVLGTGTKTFLRKRAPALPPSPPSTPGSFPL